MTTTSTSVRLHVPAMNLPSSAPLVRITAGVGTASQKTWNLKRPLTLIGSRRPAHIVLHDRQISDAHCVIINTGTDVLLKDLHTSDGTRRNKDGVDLVALQDGDVITVGSTCIQVAVRLPRDRANDSGCGLKFRDPLAMPTKVTLALGDADQQWEIEEAITLLGRHGAAGIHLDHDQVSRRHAVLFRFQDGPAIFDLGGQNGVMVNARRCPQSPLADRDTIAIGPFRLEVRTPERSTPDSPPAETSEAFATPMSQQPDASAANDHSVDLDADSKVLEPSSVDQSESSLEGGIEESWSRLNTWEAELQRNSSALEQQEAEVARRERELETQEGALRGQLHDISRLQEQLAERERSFNEKRAELESTSKQLEAIRATCADKEADVARRTQELSRREHVLAQRWMKLKSAKCPNCSTPTSTPEPDTPGDASTPTTSEASVAS